MEAGSIKEVTPTIYIFVGAWGVPRMWHGIADERLRLRASGHSKRKRLALDFFAFCEYLK
jgi:hypothetical protein